MRYLIFNILLIMLIIICIFKPYIVNEYFVNIKAEEVGFNVNLEPVEIKIIYSQKEKRREEVQPSEEIFPTQYSPPFIQQKIITHEPKVDQPTPEVQPVVTVKDITSCKTQFENRLTEINNIKKKHLSDAENLLLNRQIYDQRISLQNSEMVQQYKNEANITSQKYTDALSILNKIKDQGKECLKRFQSFNFNFEQVRNCCSSESQRALQLKQYLNEKCTVDPVTLVNKLELVTKLSNINNEIKSIKNKINQLQENNNNLNQQIDTCNNNITSIQNKIKNCN